MLTFTGPVNPPATMGTHIHSEAVRDSLAYTVMLVSVTVGVILVYMRARK